jgi:hypothetical protein
MGITGLSAPNLNVLLPWQFRQMIMIPAIGWRHIVIGSL